MKILAAAIVVVPLLAACSKDSAPAAAGSAASVPSAPASIAPAAPPAAPAPAATAAMVEIDLGSADPAWKDWVVTGPKDAKVLADGVHGARVAANGMDAFDVAFGQGKPSLKDTKAGLQAGAKAGSMKLTFTTDTADKLEWTTEVGATATKTFNFVIGYKASGKDVFCQTNSGMGVSSEAMLAQLKTACGTLHKK
jgi:hypothetical protein